ncbi:sulfatase [Roseiconus lacunae]|uniref:sulfatase n=1 Tax=Roseiconus lacunae TaxID=2605694 RepID=UPI001E346B72|nr:sulfatase [Roseiconus lacunae]MCD0462190.1 sulfatase [Roseiconus lacunae]
MNRTERPRLPDLCIARRSRSCTNKIAYGCLWLAVSLASVASPSIASAAERPNILLILVDDLAWSDLGCYGHPWHQTPHIDRLAADGLRLTHGYASAPICSASRASLMTGKTTARLGFEFVTKPEAGGQPVNEQFLLQTPPFTLNLPTEERTVAEAMVAEGYQTAFFGKWHLNQHYKRYLGWSPTHGPKSQGFEVAIENFGAHPYAWGKSQPSPIDDPGTYADDAMVQLVCDYLREPKRQPFFALASSFYVHTPVKTPCQWLVKQYDESVPQEIGRRNERVRYAAFLQTLDHHVGQILTALDASGQADDTLVFFMSDNGGHPEYTSNSPLRGSKWNLYEGGIRVPMLARYPGHIRPGTQSATPVIGYDLLPTFVELAGGQVGDLNVDGRSIAPLLLNDQTIAPQDLVWHFPYYHPERGYAKALPEIGIDDLAVSQTKPQSALRRGDHKLLWFAEDDRVELYDLVDDPGEQVDLSKRSPEQTERLRTALVNHLRRLDARMPRRPNVTAPQ